MAAVPAQAGQGPADGRGCLGAVGNRWILPSERLASCWQLLNEAPPLCNPRQAKKGGWSIRRPCEVEVWCMLCWPNPKLARFLRCCAIHARSEVCSCLSFRTSCENGAILSMFLISLFCLLFRYCCWFVGDVKLLGASPLCAAWYAIAIRPCHGSQCDSGSRPLSSSPRRQSLTQRSGCLRLPGCPTCPATFAHRGHGAAQRADRCPPDAPPS